METLARAWRHRRPWFVGGMAVFATLLGGFASTLWQSSRAVRESHRAQHQALIAEQTSEFLSRMLQASTPAEARGRDVTVREMVDAAARELGDGSGSDPQVAGSIFHTLGETYDALGEAGRAEACLRRAVELRTQSLGATDPVTLESRAALSQAVFDAGHREEAAAISGEALSDARRVLPSEHPVFINLLSSRNYTLFRDEDHAEQERLMTECVERCTRLFGSAARRTLRARSDLALAQLELGRTDQAIAALAEIVDEAQRTLGPDHPEVIAYLENQAAALQRLGRLPAAEKLINRAEDLSRRVNGPTHPSTLLALRNLTVITMMQGRFAEAEPIARRLLDARVSRLGERHPDSLEARGMYASTLIMQRKVTAARPVVDEVYRIAREAYGERDDRALQATTLYYDLAEAADDKAEMARWADRLKGTKFDPASAKQTEIPR
jgi:tetratricopeptide (TPR) repeat protein